MPTILSLPISLSEPLPSEFSSDDVRYSERFVEYCLKTFSKQNDIIFDPFAGFGTTLLIAEKMKRTSFGVEIDKQRVDYITSKLNTKESIIHGDITNLSSIAMKNFDLLLTSPPYMNSFEQESPFDNFQSKSNYSEYLNKLEMIFRELEPFMNKGGNCLVEVANLYAEGKLTTLAWDIAGRLRKFMDLQREFIICWEGEELKENRGIYGYGYDHSYLLVFHKREESNSKKNSL
ncbi:TRM11 family methyltransferase [Candidatus Lokiarchaeum ossiferum]|uniref:TRM11 family methyltransferase n=1 Tax=Candidatus Lokiarchaeum ossiferum TaxID=2951803 RepID=UPI00352FDA17